jgi:5'(3')-deoxyribonucleotidase
MLHIAVDLDEVCSDFTGSFIKRANQLLGLNIPDEPWSDWDMCKALGLTKEQAEMVWDSIKADPSFNVEMGECKRNPGIVQFLNELYVGRHAQITFITARAEHQSNCEPVQRQSSRWLALHGFPFACVHVTHEKGKLVQSLGINAFIDDNFGNCRNVWSMNPDCEIYMPVYPYNEKFIDECHQLGITTVYDSYEALNMIVGINTSRVAA